eukprot:CAMPEP_0172542600 /NCGR_PEP_ID=MMETSP1067-20121228/13171_1 /TAXON_ID=265564 ORGANISM="Thalassiosira punctigera, Strain Tpunct2005C2" /NCGR_SAMPLE_ID=MMETSP1067 /ASSEMBLY_ACC=CAM_ASM_000444 /LENGTH=960 /DNA_ID=CAMNT_0013328873 /DNA_START=367 /DNA_END=3248 /DNA_ORIENTATION=+
MCLSPPEEKSRCEAIGDKVDESISNVFYKIGYFCSFRPKTTIAIGLVVSIICAGGMAKLNTENRPEKLWVPQNTQAEVEQDKFLSYFPPSSRFQNVIASAKETGTNVLTKDNLVDLMKMHESIATGESEVENESYTFADLCTPAGGSLPYAGMDQSYLHLLGCVSAQGEKLHLHYFFTTPLTSQGLHHYSVSSLKMWSYDLARLQADTNIIGTLNDYGSREDLEGVLGAPVFDPNTGKLESAEAISISYFLKDNSTVVSGNTVDPVNEGWEEQVFLKTVQDGNKFPSLDLAYLSSRSFGDEFGSEITGDLVFVNVSYLVAFIFLGATLGSKLCGRGSRWAISLSALVLIVLATVAGFGVASLAGLLYGPVHSILPFVLLGIGVDDAFVIANAFDREREGVPRESEDDESLAKRGARSLARAGASITVTSLTDLVAFAISSSSALPALASFCAFASINIFFLWVLATTFFTSTMVLDEKRQRANRRDMLCCITRKTMSDEEDTGAKEGRIPMYFRKYHAPNILCRQGKTLTLLCFTALFGFGLFGLVKLPVEDSARNFIPQDSYINTYSEMADKYFPSSGVSLYITFENGSSIYNNRDELAELNTLVAGLSETPPYIAEPNSNSTYRNVMAGLKQFLSTNGTASIGGAALGEDKWPISYDDFVTTLANYANFRGPGATYQGDVVYNETMTDIQAYRAKLEYVRLTKKFRGEILDDASRQIEAMDATREMVESWDNLQPAFPYSDQYIAIEGFKIIGDELYRNVGLAIACVGVIVLVTVANFTAAFLITLNVAFCIVEILGFMYAIGIVIDSVSVINIVLAVGLSIDYSAHIGHCFMVKGGNDNNARATEALADMGSSVFNGAFSTFLAVAVLLFSKSYVFKTLAIQFALTVALGVIHGLILLPVLLSIFGPKPYASAEDPHEMEVVEIVKTAAPEETIHPEREYSSESLDTPVEPVADVGV